MRIPIVLGLVMCLSVAAVANSTEKEAKKEDGKVNAYSFKMNSLAGKEVDLSKYKGKVVLAVNVASRCGYTRQYAGLQDLFEKYKEKGLVVAGFPCNQFGQQEKGTSEEIASFCESRFGVTFDMFEKIEVNGDDACGLYGFLTSQETKPKGKGKVGWNFEKFLIGKDGKVIARYGSGTAPSDDELVKMIENALSK
ncbi:MAG: glutathione peroxidase [Planctomycetota bacterium]